MKKIRRPHPLYISPLLFKNSILTDLECGRERATISREKDEHLKGDELINSIQR